MSEPVAHDVSRLLAEAEDAHGFYETEALGGVYDEAWASWYASYLVEHGIEARVGRTVGAARLARVLTEKFAEYKASGASDGASWADWTARHLIADL